MKKIDIVRGILADVDINMEDKEITIFDDGVNRSFDADYEVLKLIELLKTIAQ